jgi:hypothetical protein
LWHTNQDGWLQLTNIAGAVADGRVGEGTDSAVSESSTPEQSGVLEYELEDMRGGEIGKEDVAGSEVLADDDIDTSD